MNYPHVGPASLNSHSTARRGVLTGADRLRAARHAAGLTQYQLAERAGLDPRTVLMLEHGRTQPRRTTQWRILRALGMTWQQRREIWPVGTEG